MKNVLMSFALSVLCVLGVNAQEKGDWYVGTGDIANRAWTHWAVAPTVGYGLTDKIMVGLNVSQEDSIADVVFNLHARYFYKGYFVYLETAGFNAEDLSYGVGKMFTFHRGIYVDPKVVYNATNKTTNLMLGVGLKF
tara:strand:- start:247 stop:657 length:411 start_codon:yes stop_codon:yes gene_type:complete